MRRRSLAALGLALGLALLTGLAAADPAIAFSGQVSDAMCIGSCHSHPGFTDFASWHASHQSGPAAIPCENCHPNNHTISGPSSAPDATYSLAEACMPCHTAAAITPSHATAAVTSCVGCHPPAGTLSGTVSDPSGPLAGVCVTVTGMPGVFTWADGSYVVQRIPVGTVDVTYSKDGYATQSVTGVEITDGGMAIRDVKLVDTISPSTVADVQPSYLASATIQLSATDLGPGETRAYYALDSGPQIEGTVVSISAPGIHTLEFWSVDGAGNEELPHHYVGFTIVARTAIKLTSASRSDLPYGGTFVVSGVLSRLADGLGVPAASVVLETSADKLSWESPGLRAPTGSAGSFAFSVKPGARTFYRVRFQGDSTHDGALSSTVYAIPRAYVSTPVAPTTMYRTRYYTVWGYLKPRHSRGSYAVRIYRWRYVSGSWRSYGYVGAKLSDRDSFSAYAASIKLPYAGRWRLRAYHADSGHAATGSGLRYLTVR